MRNDVVLEELHKNLYLQRLEKMYKELGITKVYSEKPAVNKPHDNTFYPGTEIAPLSASDLWDYCSDDDNNISGAYVIFATEDNDKLYPYYDNGTFYGVENAE